MKPQLTKKQLIAILKTKLHWEWLVKNPQAKKYEYPPILDKQITNNCYCCNEFTKCSLDTIVKCPLDIGTSIYCAGGIYDDWTSANTDTDRRFHARRIIKLLDDYLNDYLLNN